MFEKINNVCREVRKYVHNTLNHIRWSLVCDDLNYGRERILRGGVWIDEDGYLYNVCGKQVGKLEWNEGFGAR